MTSEDRREIHEFIVQVISVLIVSDWKDDRLTLKAEELRQKYEEKPQTMWPFPKGKSNGSEKDKAGPE